MKKTFKVVMVMILFASLSLVLLSFFALPGESQLEIKQEEMKEGTKVVDDSGGVYCQGMPHNC